jgi:DNA-binding NarL/FixJ family response regulator
MTPAPIRVFHCDDSVAFTRLVRHWLGEHGGELEHVGAAHSAGEALERLPAARPDVVLLDTMGNPGDADLVSAIRAAAPGTRVIVYSGYVRLAGRALLENGADAYLAKGDDEEALVRAIRDAVA